MPDCIFCKIAAGEIPSAKIYEDDKVFIFLDIAPVAKGHALVIPKVHAETILDLPSGFGEAVLTALARTGRAQMKALGAEGFNCLQNNFAAAGQEVMHLHWHVIPRSEGDGLKLKWVQGKYSGQAEMNLLAEKINLLM